MPAHIRSQDRCKLRRLAHPNVLSIIFKVQSSITYYNSPLPPEQVCSQRLFPTYHFFLKATPSKCDLGQRLQSQNPRSNEHGISEENQADLLSDPIVLAHSAHSHNTLRCYRTVVKQSTDVTVANPEWGSGSLSPNPLQTFGFFISLVRHQSSSKYRITNFSQLEVSKIALSLNFFSLFWLQIEKIVKKINVS